MHLRRGGAASSERADERHAPRRDVGPADDDAHNSRAARYVPTIPSSHHPTMKLSTHCKV
jgi:hypothetical protein